MTTTATPAKRSFDSSHKNSHRITVFRAPKFVEKSQDARDTAVQDYMAQASEAVGPYYEGRQSTVIGSGLEPHEVQLLLPLVLMISASDREFLPAVKNFYNSINTKIPYTTGLDLEIGLLKDNKEPVSVDNMPIKLLDYIKYRHIKKHPWVGGNAEEAKGNSRKQFYILDREDTQRQEAVRTAAIDRAMQAYLSIKEDEDKVNQLLTVLGEDVRDYMGRNYKDNCSMKLRELVNKDPVRFMDVYDNKRFETYYWLEAMKKAGLINQYGVRFTFAGSDKLMANTEMEALLWLEDTAANSEAILSLKEQTKEILAKSKKPSK